MPAWRRFEKWVARQLRKIGLDATVSCQSHGGLGSPDVDAYPFHIECKDYEKGSPSIPKALAQASRDTVKCDRYPVAVTKDSKGNVIASMYFSDFKNFVQEYLVDGRE